MEWVETTAKTIEEATTLALEQLGVDVDDADVEILEEPKSGLFGRVRAEARIRARVRPTQFRPRVEKRKPRGDKAERSADEPTRDGGGRSGGRGPRAPRTEGDRAPREPRPRGPRTDEPALEAVPADVDEAGRQFLSGLLDSMGLEGKITSRVEGHSMVEFQVTGRDLGVLIGPRAQTMQAIQELLRTVVFYETNTSSGRIVLDVAGYREKRRAALGAFTIKVAQEVVESGERRALEPMTPADRKVVHDTINDVAGVSSTSEGEEPNRYVVLLPA